MERGMGGAAQAVPGPAQGRLRAAWVLSGFDGFVRGLNVLGTAGIILLMVLINADVFGRAVLSHPFLGVPELVRLVIVSVVFLQGAHTLATGRMTRSTLGLDLVAAARPRLAARLDGLFHLAGAAVFALIAWGAWPHVARSFERGEFFGARGLFMAPVWPAKAIVFGASAVIALQFALIAWRLIRGGNRP